jgi:hypothetical protein
MLKQRLEQRAGDFESLVNLVRATAEVRSEALPGPSRLPVSSQALSSTLSLESLGLSTKSQYIDTLFILVNYSISHHTLLLIFHGISQDKKGEDGASAREEGRETQGGKTAVLGANTLALIHEDIVRMSLPSWIGRVPSDLGSTRHGTLSQDALRTTTTVTLVSSLTRIWGSHPLERREAKMLSNFLDLAISIDLALMQRTSLEKIEELYNLWLQYLHGIRRLFPHCGLIPNQHISLHLRTTLKNFGPAPGQRTNVCERINFLLQKVPTNSRSGLFISSVGIDY